MDRTPPAAKSDEIELYLRTYYSLLRSTGPVRIRSLEETHKRLAYVIPMLELLYQASRREGG